MYTAIREYRMTAGSVDDLMHKVDVGLADVFADQEGFLGYEVLDAGDGRIVSITTFTDRSSAQNSNELAPISCATSSRSSASPAPDT